jgi:two-component system sensor histidine kinase TctE
MIEELITNLIENAIAYGANVGSKITVRIYNKGHGIDLEVEDDGPGIPIAERAKVFERFYRVLGSRTSGSGLGLSIVREIAHAHSATVHLGNGQNNKGTKITVKFPTINKQALSGAAIAGSATEAELVGSTRN